MNCLEFESQREIHARGALADARTLAATEAHRDSCEACAARLADEQALSTGLRALAEGMKASEAPARVETALLAAFRARAASESSSDAVAVSNVVPLSGHAPARTWSWAKTIAVASMAAAASLALFVLVRPEVPRRAPVESAMIEPPPGAVVKGTTARDDSKKVVETGRGDDADGLTTQRPSHVPRTRAVNASLNSRGGGPSRPPLTSNARPQEVATEFIPLTRGPFTPSEEGHLVRVELPRSALASFGLPLNAEATGGRVKADVLLGEDGVARAIRFVR